MKPEDVPDEYVQMMADAEFDAPAGCSAEDSYRTVLAAVLPEHERQVRERVAAEYRDAAKAIEEGPGDSDDPLAKAIQKACVRGPGGMTYDDPRDIAYVAYRNLAKRLTRGES